MLEKIYYLFLPLLVLVIIFFSFDTKEKEAKEGILLPEPSPSDYRLAMHERVLCDPACFEYQGVIRAERLHKERLERQRLARLRAAKLPPLISAKNIPKDLKNPNSYRIALSEAPPLGQGKKVNGRFVCAKKKDKPRESKENNDNVHIDRECCLDPDEIPHPLCDYTYKAK